MATADAIQFLRQWPTQRMHLWSKVPEGRVEAYSFDRTDVGYVAAEKWIAERNGRANLYFVVNDISISLGVTMREDAKDGKTKPALMPRESDVTRMVATQVDSDPRVNLEAKTPEEHAEHFAAEKVRLLKVYDEFDDPKLNVVVFTGGGCQGFHLFKEPIVVDGDPVKIAAAKLLNVALKRAPGFAGSDDCESLQHVMRLPGTANLPDDRKRRKGRTPSDSFLVRFEDSPLWYDAAELPRAEPDPEENRYAEGFKDSGKYEKIKPADACLVKVDEKWLRIGQFGDTENKYLDRDGKTDRSRMALAFVTALKRAKVDDQIIASILMDPAWKIGECIRDKAGETQRQLKRVIERGGKFVDEDFDKPAMLGADTWMKNASQFLVRECPDLVHYNDEFFVYKGISYRATETVTIRSLVGRFLHKSKLKKLVQPADGEGKGEFVAEPFNPNAANINEMMNALTVICHVDRDDIETASWKVSAV